MKPLNWDSLDWAALDRLRDIFLAGRAGGPDYWTCRSDLENYDITFARRIAWKWNAVLRELRLRGWTPPAGPLLDWGCGSGAAGRAVLEFFGPGLFSGLRLQDRSPLATAFAAEKARQMFPSLEVVLERARGPADAPANEGAAPPAVGTLVVSHVLNELDEPGGRALRLAIDRAGAVLWVEPGTQADSRTLVALREDLRGAFHAIAPCTHQAGCGLLAPENRRHWCHHFAQPPPNIMADGNWVRFARRAGIDLRSLPYSFLVLERKGARDPVPGLPPGGSSRILGRPRLYKGYMKVFSCRAEGVEDLTLQKRDAPGLFKAIERNQAEPVHQWNVDGGRIRGLESSKFKAQNSKEASKTKDQGPKSD